MWGLWSSYNPHIYPYSMPYPLPDDPESVTNLAWKLIAIPDDPAYSRAALDRYSGISDVWNWGMEGVEAGSHIARQSWLTAVLATLELWDMNPLETIIGHIDGVETLLQQLLDAQCCADQYQDPIADLKTDDWQPGDGVPQNVVDAGFASSTSDFAGYDDYKCLVANVVVDDLLNQLERWPNLLDASNNVIGGIAALAGLIALVLGTLTGALTPMAIGIILGLGQISDIYQWLTSTGKTGVQSAHTLLVAARDDLACAVYSADGNESAKGALRDEIEATTSATVADAVGWLTDAVIDALYAGRYDTINTAQALDDAGFTASTFDCSACVTGYVIKMDYGTDNGGGSFTSGVVGSGQNVRFRLITDVTYTTPIYADITFYSDTLEGGNYCSADDAYIIDNNGTAPFIYGSNTMPPTTVRGHFIQVEHCPNSTPFTVAIGISNPSTSL